MKREVIRHEFVEYVPNDPEEGVLYVSVPFATAVHKCACGCGSEVVTPLSPTDWSLVFDGKTTSLEPSIGNWNFACQSHYWIRRDRIVWARQWTQKQIDAGRAVDRMRKQGDSETDSKNGGLGQQSPKKWRRLKRFLGR